MTTSDAELGATAAAELAALEAEAAAAAGPSGRSRIVWTFADQGLSSLTNAALAIVVARSVSPGDFGAFALALTTFGFIVGLARTTVGEPFVVRFSAASRPERARGTRDASGAALSLGVLAAFVCLIVAALVGGDAAAAFAALAISLPGLVLQDTWRHLFFASGRAAAATANDLVWAVVQFLLLGILLVNGDKSIFLITLAWGASALVAAVFGSVQMGIVPAPFAVLRWLIETRDLNLRLGAGYALNMGAVTLATYAIAGIVGKLAVGALRAAQVVLGPLNLLFGGFNAFALPLLSRRAVAGQRLVRDGILASLLLGAITGVWVLILVLLPNRAGRLILGDSWAGADRVILPAGLLMLTVALVLGASNSLIALSRADQVLKVTLVQGPLMLGLGVFAAWRWGVVGAAYAFAIAQGVGLVYTWLLFIKADADPRRWADVVESEPSQA